jgi:hypothetical protein
MRLICRPLAALGLSICSSLTGCSQGIQWRSANIALVSSATKIPPEPVKSVTLTDADQIRRLVTFLPGVGNPKGTRSVRVPATGLAGSGLSALW